MTKYARIVLEDCKCAHNLLEEETDPIKWRVHWVGAMALIRAVGHVLKEVDARKNNALAAQIKRAYLEWCEDDDKHVIFREFIKKGRDNLLKEYQSDVYPKSHIDLVVEEERCTPEIFTLDENLYRPLRGDFSFGEDARDVYLEAINWWHEELEKLEDFSNSQ